MTHPIIKTDNYLLITSDELVEKNYGYSPKSNEIFYYTKDFYGKGHESWVNIIAHLPLNNSPILEGVPLLPPIHNEEDDLDKESDKYAGLIGNKDGTAKFDFKRGYNKAKEKYKFTEDDIRKAIAMGFDWCHQKHIPHNWMIDNFIQSLSQTKLPVGFKCRMELNPVNHAAGLKLTGNLIMDIAITQNYTPKIINGVMQGEWIFE